MAAESDNHTQIATVSADALPTPLQLGAKARAYAARSKADNTIRAYRQAWADFVGWCTSMGFDPRTADPYAIGLYLAHGADRLKPSTLRLRLAALASIYRRAGQPFDARHADIASIMDGIARVQGLAPRRVAPVLAGQLAAMVAALPAGTVGVRDRAMLLVGFGGALRRSELVALDLEDAQIVEAGIVLTLRRSKTDQHGLGAQIAIHRAKDPALCAARALDAWLKLRGGGTGPLFQQIARGGRVLPKRLSAMAVVRAVKAAVAAAGLDASGYAGHSLRAGLATSAAQKGANLTRIMGQTRHKSVETARTYVREAEIWQDNVTDLLL